MDRPMVKQIKEQKSKLCWGGDTWEVILPKVDLRAQGLLFHVNTNLR